MRTLAKHFCVSVGP